LPRGPAQVETATKKVLALNTGMFEPYSDAAPVIFALFSGAGPRFILYRPSMAPLEEPPFPVVYQLLESVDHSTIALAEVVGPQHNLDEQSWHGLMLAYRSKLQSAQDGLDATDKQEKWRPNNRSILQNNIAFMAAWKKLLGGAWDKTYAASDSIYLTCQNYILFSLAQFFGPDVMNSRLILIETISSARRYGELNV
jgi:hypothetical protein